MIFGKVVSDVVFKICVINYKYFLTIFLLFCYINFLKKLDTGVHPTNGYVLRSDVNFIGNYKL